MRRRTMLLEGKNAVIYGGAGSVGGAVARAFAREGATVFLAGRTRETLEAVAGEIRSGGGRAEGGGGVAPEEKAGVHRGEVSPRLEKTTRPPGHSRHAFARDVG